jgi:hypothetical protein
MDCARALALRALKAAPTDEERLSAIFKICLTREPKSDEATVLASYLERQRAKFKEAGSDPWPLLIDQHKSKQEATASFPQGATPAEVAAWTALSRVVLNLDETITKE